MKKLHQRTANSAFNTWRDFASERQRLDLKMTHCLAALSKRSMAAAFHTWQVSKAYHAGGGPADSKEQRPGCWIVK